MKQTLANALVNLFCWDKYTIDGDTAYWDDLYDSLNQDKHLYEINDLGNLIKLISDASIIDWGNSSEGEKYWWGVCLHLQDVNESERSSYHHQINPRAKSPRLEELIENVRTRLEPYCTDDKNVCVKSVTIEISYTPEPVVQTIVIDGKILGSGK